MTGQVGSERPRSYSNEDIQLSSAVVLATDLYPASVEERAMIFCFLELQEIGSQPR